MNKQQAGHIQVTLQNEPLHKPFSVKLEISPAQIWQDQKQNCELTEMQLASFLQNFTDQWVSTFV